MNTIEKIIKETAVEFYRWMYSHEKHKLSSQKPFLMPEEWFDVFLDVKKKKYENTTGKNRRTNHCS